MIKKRTHEELLERQKQIEARTVRIPLAVVLNDIRSLYNVGSLFRTADAVGAGKIWLCGITGIPPDPKIAKTALDAQETVPWEYCEKAADCLRRLKADGYEIVMMEQTNESVPYELFEPRGPVALVLGNETGGICEELMPYADRALEIEMAGHKNSLNVTVAFGVAAYSLRRKLTGMVSKS